jgi:hypothetical protein
MAQYVYDQQNPGQISDTTLSKIGTIAQGAGGLITAIDRALHPSKYTYPQGTQQTYPQPYPVQQTKSGFGWGQALLLMGVGAGVLYGGKELLDHKKSKK